MEKSYTPKYMYESRMIDSMKKDISELYTKFETPIHIILYIVLMTSIIYVKEIPDTYKYYGSNIILRFVLFGIALAICKYISYVHAMLFAIFVVLYVSFTPGMKEAFEDLRIVARKEQKWFDEKVLGEEPELMETEKVRTEAVQS
jgi:hypothetical protein